MPNKILRVRESPIVFSTAGTLLTLTSLGNNAGRYSSRYDRGILAAPGELFGRAVIKLAVAAAVGTILTIYAFESDGTTADGTLGTVDAALTADKRRNGTPIGVIVADAASVGPFAGAIGLFEVHDRYLQLGVYNEMGQALSAVAGDHAITLWPLAWEVQ